MRRQATLAIAALLSLAAGQKAVDAACGNGSNVSVVNFVIRPIIADDHQVVREGLKAVLAQHRDVDVVGEVRAS